MARGRPRPDPDLAPVQLEVLQLPLAQVVDEAGADRVAQHVDGRAEPGEGRREREGGIGKEVRVAMDRK